MYPICPSAQCVKKLNSAAAVPKICEPHYFSTHCSSCFRHKYASSHMFHILFMWLPVLWACIISCKSFFLRFQWENQTEGGVGVEQRKLTKQSKLASSFIVNLRKLNLAQLSTILCSVVLLLHSRMKNWDETSDFHIAQWASWILASVDYWCAYHRVG